MGESKEFQKNADQCFARAYETQSLASHVHWMQMGRLWSAVARNIEQGSSASTLADDMAQLWITLASQLSGRMDVLTMSTTPRRHLSRVM
jgi:hypothetical protein